MYLLTNIPKYKVSLFRYLNIVIAFGIITFKLGSHSLPSFLGRVLYWMNRKCF